MEVSFLPYGLGGIADCPPAEQSPGDPASPSGPTIESSAAAAAERASVGALFIFNQHPETPRRLFHPTYVNVWPCTSQCTPDTAPGKN